MTEYPQESQFGSLRTAWLEAFVLTVDCGKQTAAAAEMGVTQGTVARHMKKLECWYGGGPSRVLLLPNMYPPRLTEDGEAFLPVARQALDSLRAAQKQPPKPEPRADDPDHLSDADSEAVGEEEKLREQSQD